MLTLRLRSGTSMERGAGGVRWLRILLGAALGTYGVMAETDPCADSSSWLGQYWQSGSPFQTEEDLDSCERSRDILETWPDFEGKKGDFVPKTKASLIMKGSQGQSPQSILFHRTETDLWNSRLELHRDTLSHAQLGLHRGLWDVHLGDIKDTLLPLRPSWLSISSQPQHWTPNSESEWAGIRNHNPIRAGASLRLPQGRLFLLRAWQALQPAGSAPQPESWNLQHVAWGVESSLSGHPSMHMGETHLSRLGADSLSERWISLQLASPQKQVELHWAWLGSQAIPLGGQAWGARVFQPLGALGILEGLFTQRGRGWSSAWDRDWRIPKRDSDSLLSSWGAGEFALRLRIPLSQQSFLESESWQTWKPGGQLHRAGIRGRMGLSRNNVHMEIAGNQAQTLSSKDSTRFHTQLTSRVLVGENWQWEWETRHDWVEGVNRQAMGLALNKLWMRIHWRPGIRVKTADEDSIGASPFLGAQIRLGSGWTGEAQSVWDLVSPFYQPVKWKVSIQYSGGKSPLRHLTPPAGLGSRHAVTPDKMNSNLLVTHESVNHSL